MKNDVNIEEVANILDGQKQQADFDCEEEGTEADPQYDHLDRGNHNEYEFLPSNNWCKKIDLKDDEQLYKEAQSLDKNQRQTFDIWLKYAGEVVKARSHQNMLPEVPNLIVVGGAGSGKINGDTKCTSVEPEDTTKARR